MYIDMVRHHVVNAGGRLVRSLVCSDSGARLGATLCRMKREIRVGVGFGGGLLFFPLSSEGGEWQCAVDGSSRSAGTACAVDAVFHLAVVLVEVLNENQMKEKKSKNHNYFVPHFPHFTKYNHEIIIMNTLTHLFFNPLFHQDNKTIFIFQ